MTKKDAKFLKHMTPADFKECRSDEDVSLRMYRGTVREAYAGETERYHYQGQKIHFYPSKADRFYWFGSNYHTLEDAKSAIDAALAGPEPDRDSDPNKVVKAGSLEGSLKARNNNHPCPSGWSSRNHKFRVDFPKASGGAPNASNYSNPYPLPKTGRSVIRQRLSFPNPDMTVVSYRDPEGHQIGRRYFAAYSQEAAIQRSTRLWISEGRIEGGQPAY